MTSTELRKKFLTFFEKKGHKIVPSSSLIPGDSSVLFTSAGMQQFIPYLSGERDILKDFNNRHLCSVQKCFRSNDIDEVGDDTHHTFFEMPGNWSIGEDSKTGYFKRGAIEYALEFFIEILKLDKDKFWITFFSGQESIPEDQESINVWKENGIPQERMRGFGIDDNFWGPLGDTGPCGPCSEIHYDRGEKYGCGDPVCGPNCKKCDRFVELWNLVFMEYSKNQDGSYSKLPQRNVDTGIGFERLTSVLQGKDSAYESDLFLPIIQKTEELSGKKYEENRKYFRIITDHIRGSVFLVSAGILPSNVETGYVLRRILRRAIRYGRLLGLAEESGQFLLPLAEKVIEIYKDVYPELKSKEADILTIVQKEEEKFEKTLEEGLKQFEKGLDAFELYTSYGFPLELTMELAKEKGRTVDLEEFNRKFKEHQELSRTASAGMFKGGLADTGKQAVKYHTATHLLLAALRQVLGPKVYQRGSNINAERLRFDFSHSQKMTPEQIKKVEDIVNQKIKEDLPVICEETSLEEAKKKGATGVFETKYGEKVKVYGIGKFSKEICGGPHVERTSELGEFKILKEESSAAGVRRIRAILK